MELITTVVDKLRGFSKSTNDRAQALLRESKRNSPIEILKRLQREAFSDIMKLRDRQEKVERILTFYKSSKGSPFQESSTHVRGKIGVLGAFFIMDDVDEQKCGAITKSGIRTGVDTRLSFETGISEKHKLVAEFVAGERGRDGMLGSPLSLAKVFYEANFSDWFSTFVSPVGAHCRDLPVGTSSNQDRAISEYSEYGPPLLNQYNGSTIGIMVRKSNIVASLAQFVSNIALSADSSETERTFGTFAQVILRLSESTKLSLMGLHRITRQPNRGINLGALAVPISIFNQNRHSDTSAEDNDSPAIQERQTSNGSIALMLNKELDENARIGGWIETRTSNPGYYQWAVTVSDTPEDELGWGLTFGGLVKGLKNCEHFQAETFLNFNVGGRFKFRPALVYVRNGATQFPALVLRSDCSL